MEDAGALIIFVLIMGIFVGLYGIRMGAYRIFIWTPKQFALIHFGILILYLSLVNIFNI